MSVQRLMVMGLVAMSSMACADTGTPPLVAGEPDASRAAMSQRPAASPTIVDVALEVNAESGEFTTLIAAVVSAGLVDALSAVGQRTVFAPTDAAFAMAGLNAQNVVDVPVDVLTNILLYHVAPGRRYESDVAASDRIRMANGDFTTIQLVDGAAYIDDALIFLPDVEATNGVIHVIDAVLLP